MTLRGAFLVLRTGLDRRPSNTLHTLLATSPLVLPRALVGLVTRNTSKAGNYS